MIKTRAMRAVILVLMFSLLATCFAYELRADGTFKVPKQNLLASFNSPGMKKKMSLDIRAMDIVNLLKFFATEGDLNIITSKNVSGPVNLLINNVTIADALEIVLALGDFAYEIRGNIITVMTSAEYKAAYGVEFYDQRHTVIYQLKYASVKNVAAMLGNIKSDIGKIVSDEATGTIVIIDTPFKIKEMDEVISKQELPTVNRVLPTQTKVFELKYAKVDAVKDEISKLLTTDIGSLRMDTRTNTLVITDLPFQIVKIETVIKAFDRRTREVFIEAKMVEVTLGDKFQWGVDWDYIQKLAKRWGGYTLAPAIHLPLALTNAFGQLTINSVSSDSLNAILQALDTVTETRILSNPHLTVEEGKEAKIQVIEKQPYQEQTTTTASGGTTTTANSYQWVNVGITLNVTPRINSEGYISMLIKPEVSSISTWYGGAAQTAGAVPVVKSANAETSVTIKDNTTIIIAGLIKDNKSKTVNKIPLLGDIPGIGKAFQNTTDEIIRTETIVFLTPRIVTGDKEFLLKKDMSKPIGGVRK